MTNLKSLKPGDPVNLEVDVMAKYLEKILRGASDGPLRLEDLVRRGF
jgi:riboflavin synthase alpha subunit